MSPSRSEATRRHAVASALAAVALAACSLPAAAHDSWLADAPGARSAGTTLVLGTGNRYPLAETAPPAEAVAGAGCVDARGRRHALRAAGWRSTALLLRSPAKGAAGCWAELTAHDITLAPALVDVYFREIRPPETVRAAWAAQAEQGLPWQERYRKFARIEQGSATVSAAQRRAIRAPLGLPLEIVVLGDAALRTGQPATFQVLLDGQPLAGLAVELVSERSPLGVWAQSDAKGEVRHVLPFAGSWLLRATWVAPAEAPGAWRSRFVTLAFEAS